MALTDGFTDADGTLLTAHNTSTGSPWTAEENSSPEIQSNKASPVYVGRSAVGAPGTFPDDQFTEAVLKTADADGNYGFITVRMSGDTYFFAYLNHSTGGSELQVKKRVAGSDTFLNSAPHGLADGASAVITLTVTGTGGSGLAADINGVPTVITTAAAIASGKTGCGFQWNNAGTKPTLDSFQSSDPSGGGGSTRRALALLGAG